MATNQTVENNASVREFLDKIQDEGKRSDCHRLSELMANQTGLPAKMWGPGIVGFGSYHYIYESGREGDAPRLAFAPRSSSIVLYLSTKMDKREELLEKLGKYKLSGGCIHFKKLDDINIPILQKMIASNMKYMKKEYPEN